MSGQKGSRRWQWRDTPRGHLVRWQDKWALLVPVPAPLQQVRVRWTAKTAALSGTFAVLAMAERNGSWVATERWCGHWTVNLPLGRWRLVGAPQLVKRQGQCWLLLPVRPHQR